MVVNQIIFLSAQFFDAFTADKRFFSGGGKGGGGGGYGGGGGGGGLFGGLGGILGGGGGSSGGGSSYGAPKPSYGAPTNKPSYGPTNKPSYGPTNKPSYGSKGMSFKNIELPIPDIPLPDPVEFKAGVLRSKGRIGKSNYNFKLSTLDGACF